MKSELSPLRAGTIDNEELQEEMLPRGGCCFFIPGFGSRLRNSTWERIATSENEDRKGCWWSRGVKALKKVREWSDLVAGLKWKTFIRRFNKNRNRPGKFQYDPMSYSLNFDEGHVQSGRNSDDDRFYHDFPSRYTAIPGSVMSSVDFGKDARSFT